MQVILCGHHDPNKVHTTPSPEAREADAELTEQFEPMLAYNDDCHHEDGLVLRQSLHAHMPDWSESE